MSTLNVCDVRPRVRATSNGDVYTFSSAQDNDGYKGNRIVYVSLIPFVLFPFGSNVEFMTKWKKHVAF